MDRMAKLVSGRLKVPATPGPHPGPELLAAFAENALPEADRGQLLQHLGACSDCREILYLALPYSPELQKVLILEPRVSKRWALRWGALVASVVVVTGLFVAKSPLFHARYKSFKGADAPAVSTYSKISEKKVPAELDALRDDRVAEKGTPQVTAKQRPEAKHMTAKPQATLAFEDSDQVRVSTPTSSQRVNSPLQSLPARGRSVAPLVGVTTSRAKPVSPPQPFSRPAKAKNELGYAYSNPGMLGKESTLKGNLGGIILDPSGAVVGDAKITMVGPIGTKSVSSDAEGRFSFDLLTPGSYSLKAEASGFKATEIKQVAVLLNKTSTVQVRLEPGSVSEVVEVSAAAPGADKAVEMSGAAPALDSSTGFVAQRQPTTAHLSVQKAAAANSRRQAGATAVPPLLWTLSPEGAVQRSGDSGRTWQAVSVTAGATFRALSAVGANVWVGGRAGALYHTADSGQTWAKVEPATEGKKLDQDIVHLDFSDPLSGTVNTANGEVWTTSDGGQSWLHR